MIVGGELLVRPRWVGVFYHFCARGLSSFSFSALKFSLERFNYSSAWSCEWPADRLLAYQLHRASSISQHRPAQGFTAAFLCTARAQSTGAMAVQDQCGQSSTWSRRRNWTTSTISDRRANPTRDSWRGMAVCFCRGGTIVQQ